MYVFEEYKNSNKTIFMPSVCQQALLFDHLDLTFHALWSEVNLRGSEALRSDKHWTEYLIKLFSTKRNKKI